MESGFTFSPIDITHEVIRLLREEFSQKHLNPYLTVPDEAIAGGLRFILLYLREAILFRNPAIFTDNYRWFLNAPFQRQFPEFLSASVFANLRKAFENLLPEPSFRQVSEILDAISLIQPPAAAVSPSYLEMAGTNPAVSQLYLQHLLDFEQAKAEALLLDMASAGNSVNQIYRTVLMPVQYEVGRLWHSGMLSPAQEHYCTVAAQSVMQQLMLRTSAPGSSPGSFLGLCISGEYHSLGIRMVCDAFRLAGWKTLLLDGNTPPHDIPGLLQHHPVEVIGISITLPWHFHAVSEFISLLRQSATIQMPAVLVGGLAFNTYPEIWRKVGADGYSRSAEEAVVLAGRLITKSVV